MAVEIEVADTTEVIGATVTAVATTGMGGDIMVAMEEVIMDMAAATAAGQWG